jgi:CRISPR type III-A-associated protein Csm2
MTVIQEMKAFFKDGRTQFGEAPASSIVSWAENSCIAKDISKSTTSTQLRRFYDAIRGIWDTPDSEKLDAGNQLKEAYLARLIFLKPAFTGAANKGKIEREFKDIMLLSIDRVKNKDDFYKFLRFFEAIIQYTK